MSQLPAQVIAANDQNFAEVNARLDECIEMMAQQEKIQHFDKAESWTRSVIWWGNYGIEPVQLEVLVAALYRLAQQRINQEGPQL